MEGPTLRALKSLHLHLLENAQMDAEQANVEREVERLEAAKADLERERDLLRQEHEKLKEDESLLEEVEKELKREKAVLDKARRALEHQSASVSVGGWSTAGGLVEGTSLRSELGRSTQSCWNLREASEKQEGVPGSASIKAEVADVIAADCGSSPLLSSLKRGCEPEEEEGEEGEKEIEDEIKRNEEGEDGSAGAGRDNLTQALESSLPAFRPTDGNSTARVVHDSSVTMNSQSSLQAAAPTLPTVDCAALELRSGACDGLRVSPRAARWVAEQASAALKSAQLFLSAEPETPPCGYSSDEAESDAGELELDGEAEERRGAPGASCCACSVETLGHYPDGESMTASRGRTRIAEPAVGVAVLAGGVLSVPRKAQLVDPEEVSSPGLLCEACSSSRRAISFSDMSMSASLFGANARKHENSIVNAESVLRQQLNRVLKQEGAVVALIRRAILQHKAVLARCDRASALYDSLLAQRDVVTGQYNKVLTLKRRIIDEMKAFKAERDSLFVL